VVPFFSPTLYIKKTKEHQDYLENAAKIKMVGTYAWCRCLQKTFRNYSWRKSNNRQDSECEEEADNVKLTSKQQLVSWHTLDWFKHVMLQGKVSTLGDVLQHYTRDTRLQLNVLPRSLEVEMSTQQRSPSVDISTLGQHIWMSQEHPCFICSVIVFFICRIVSPTFKYDELRLKMSHEGTARVRHLCVCVLFMYIYAYFPLLCRNRVHTFVVCFYTKWINEWISSSVLQGTWSWQTHTQKPHNIRDNRLHACDVAE